MCSLTDSHKWSTCSYAMATTSPCSVGLHWLHVVVTHWLHQHVHCEMLSSEESTWKCSVRIYIRFNKNVVHIIQSHSWDTDIAFSFTTLSVLCEKVSNIPLPVHQHVLHSAVKCLPPQHVHSEMPHTVQSAHSVKTICALSNIIMKARKQYNYILHRKNQTWIQRGQESYTAHTWCKSI